MNVNDQKVSLETANQGDGFDLRVDDVWVAGGKSAKQLSEAALEAGATSVSWTGEACLAWFRMGG